MRKGRHRRFEQARALKRANPNMDLLFSSEVDACPECGARPGEPHASWCEAEDQEQGEEK